MRCLDKVKHPNFKIWFDAGNIIYYTGKDPLEQLKPIASQVTGFCAKDCDKQNGTVWLQFGTGKVDFRAVFAELKRAGFNGPVMVECCALGDTPEIVTRQRAEEPGVSGKPVCDAVAWILCLKPPTSRQVGRAVLCTPRGRGIGRFASRRRAEDCPPYLPCRPAAGRLIASPPARPLDRCRPSTRRRAP